MGNGCCKFVACFSAGGREVRRRKENSDEGFGHSFLYVRPDQTRISSSKVHSEEETTTFRTISGASVSANISTPPSTLFPPFPSQPIPRGTIYSGPIISGSGPIIPGFLSGPIDRAGFFMSGPLEKTGPDQFQRSVSGSRVGSRNGSMIRVIRRAISKRISLGGGGRQNPIMGPIKGSIPPKEQPDWVFGSDHTHNENLTVNSLSTLMSSEGSSLLLDDGVSMESQNLQWAQGKAGEDRVHVVVSEEHKCVFVGIYDGFNGPDAPDYLMSNLYPAVHTELKGLLWDDNNKIGSENQASPEEKDFINESCSEQNSDDKSNIENHRRWRCQWKNEMLIPEKSTAANHHPEKSTAADHHPEKSTAENHHPERWTAVDHHPEKSTAENHPPEKLTDVDHNPEKSTAVNHQEVLNALSEALRKTEEAYLENADKMLDENPELALMGSCVLVMLMKGEDVYVMNVGDSRAVLGQNTEPEFWLGKIKQDLERINEETMNDLEERSGSVPSLGAFQLTFDHSTSIEEEVERIWNEHPDDSCAVTNERVKGSLQVTRAFGAGFLKQPKWNDALLEMFRIDYIGTSPYINCLPSLYHHRLGPKDRFLILSSDGLYQYFTNEEAVSEVELFITLQPEGDPAQHLVEELLFRAAKKAGMDFHELLGIPQGERRRYHDDVSIIIISFEGRIWRSCV